MAEYLAPSVYIEDTASVAALEAVGASCGGFVGIAQRGVVGEAKLITSWTAYITEYADGMDSPFISTSDLAYAVYGFFQNGGKRCYVTRVAGESYAKATGTITVEGSTDTTILYARDAGAWANDKLKVAVTANEDDTTRFNIAVSFGDEVVENFNSVSNDTEDSSYWIDVLKYNSNYVTGATGGLSVVDSIVFTGGNDGATPIDTDYSSVLTAFDVCDDLNLLAIPGQTSTTLILALLDYCDGRKYVFPIIDLPKTCTVTTAKAMAKTISNHNGACYYPWGKISDPLSTTGKLRDCPPSGHIMGVYARTITERGVWKAPAGTDALIRGFVDLTTTLTFGDIEVLNPARVCCITYKPNYGIVVWGARSLSTKSEYKYVSDVLLDNNIKKSVYEGTQPYVFEPNGPATWARVITTVTAFLDSMWREGALYGEPGKTSASEAYYVKCDAELNTEAVRQQGKMITEIGYANEKPAEFVIFRFSHTITGTSD